jgi:hypothetical protein
MARRADLAARHAFAAVATNAYVRSMLLVDVVREGQVPAVLAALDAGSELDTADAGGWTALMIACRDGYAPIARLLIERGARLDTIGPGGETALGLAMVRCRGVAELLVERGVLGRPLRVPSAGALLAPRDCDVCARYPDLIDPADRWSEAPAELAWLEIVEERCARDGKTDVVERTLRCTCCGTRYDQFFAYQVETAGVTPPRRNGRSRVSGGSPTRSLAGWCRPDWG